ncbi:MAG: hypothetical protein IPM60_07910 [Rhodospirillales bacterium]|nr:hypothetical protein [Rhodospirillales bacterium]
MNRLKKVYRLTKIAGLMLLVATVVAPVATEAATVNTRSASFSALSADNFNTSAVPGYSGDAYGNWGVVSPLTPALQSGLVWKGVDKPLAALSGERESLGTIVFRNTETFGQQSVRVKLDVNVDVDNGASSGGSLIIVFLINQHLNSLPPASCPSMWSASYGCGDDISIVDAKYTGDIGGRTVDLELATNTFSVNEETTTTLAADVRLSGDGGGVQPIPVPGAVWLFATGIAALGAAAARRKRVRTV